MIFFLIIIGFALTIFLLLFLLFISTIQIETDNLVINSINKKENKINLYVRLKILNKITYLKIKVNKEKMSRFKVSNKRILKKINQIQNELINNRRKVLNIDVIRLLNRLNVEIDKLNLFLKIGLSDAFLTSIIVGMISALISILISKNTKEYSDKYYSILPDYNKTPLVKINLNCIINIKMIHIINVIYMLSKKKRSGEYNERTSDRRTYASINDQY